MTMLSRKNFNVLYFKVSCSLSMDRTFWTYSISWLYWFRTVLHEGFVGKIATKFRRKLAWRDLSYWLLSLFPDMDRYDAGVYHVMQNTKVVGGGGLELSLGKK